MSIEKVFLSRFAGSDFITQNKARVFMYYSFLMFVLLALLVVLYAVIPLPPELSRKGILGGIGISLLVLVSLFVLRSGNLRAAFWTYALPTILGVAAIRYINSGPSPETAFSTYIFYMPYLIVIVAVFGQRWQVPVTTLFFALTNLAVWLRVRDATGLVASSANTGIINSSIGLLVTGVVSYSLVNIMDKYAMVQKGAADLAAAKVEKVKGAMSMAHDGLDVGATLVRESVSMEQAASVINATIDTIKQDLASLSDDIHGTRDANAHIVESTRVLGQSSEGYQSMAVQASSAVIQMTASIENITGISTKNRDSVDSLAASISDGLEKADGSGKTIAQLAQNSRSLLDIVGVISNISEQIDMLAMNAAIEAAHAGETGKGFAVVADEISRLAEATAQNSQAITEGLESFFRDIGDAEAANRHIDSAFQEISGGIGRTQAAFEEILSGMTDLATGTKDINRAVTDVVSSSRGVSGSIKNMDVMIKQNTGAIDAVLQKTGHVLAALDNIMAGFSDILARSANVRSLGEQSTEVIGDLDEAIRSLNES